MSIEGESLKGQLILSQNQSLIEFEAYKKTQITKITELEQINKALRGIIEGNHGQIEKLMDDKKKMFNEKIGAEKAKIGSEFPDSGGKINLKEINEEQIRKIEDANKFLEGKVRFFLNEIEKVSKKEQENERKIEEKNKIIQEILLEKKNLTEKIYNCEQERLRYMNEGKKSNDKTTELNEKLAKEAILKQDLANYRLGNKKKK